MYDLNLLLDKRYDIVMNDNADEYYGARIVIHAISHRNETLKHITNEIINLEKENGITRRV